MFISKTKLLMAVLVMALVVPAAAYANDAWNDVDNGKFYHDAVTWAQGNGMTTGCNGGTGFCPDRVVTRGENITFAKRYDDLNQVWLADIQAAAADATRVYFARVTGTGTVQKTSTDPLSVDPGAANDGVYTVTLPEAAENCAVESSLSWQVPHQDDFASQLIYGLVNLGYTTSGTHVFHVVNNGANDVTVFTYTDNLTDTDSPVLSDMGFTITAHCSNP